MEHLLSKSTEGGVAYLEQAVAAADTVEKSAENGDGSVRFKETLSPATAESAHLAPTTDKTSTHQRDGLRLPELGKATDKNDAAATTRQQQKGAVL